MLRVTQLEVILRSEPLAGRTLQAVEVGAVARRPASAACLSQLCLSEPEPPPWKAEKMTAPTPWGSVGPHL